MAPITRYCKFKADLISVLPEEIRSRYFNQYEKPTVVEMVCDGNPTVATMLECAIAMTSLLMENEGPSKYNDAYFKHPMFKMTSVCLPMILFEISKWLRQEDSAEFGVKQEHRDDLVRFTAGLAMYFARTLREKGEKDPSDIQNPSPLMYESKYSRAVKKITKFLTMFLYHDPPRQFHFCDGKLPSQKTLGFVESFLETDIITRGIPVSQHYNVALCLVDILKRCISLMSHVVQAEVKQRPTMEGVDDLYVEHTDEPFMRELYNAIAHLATGVDTKDCTNTVIPTLMMLSAVKYLLLYSMKYPWVPKPDGAEGKVESTTELGVQ